MALSITIDGFVYKGDSSLSSSDVAYQAYFYKVNAGSSTSKWNDKRIVENTGYYNINIGDGDWLTQDGSASTNDIVVIVFWDPAADSRLDVCTLLNEWSCFRIVLDGSSTYTTQAQVKSNICPNLSWSLGSDGLVGVNVIASNSSNDTHQWDFMSTTFYQRNLWYTSLMTVNVVNNSVYSWGDTNQDTVSGAGNGSHSYVAAGDYDVELVVEDECGCTVTGTDQVRIEWNAPVPNIEQVPAAPDPNVPVSFNYIGTDPDSGITSIDWTINDTGVYGTTNTTTTVSRDDNVPHTSGQGTDWCSEVTSSGAYTNPGSHVVAIVVHWWDGFASQTINYSETYSQGIFSGPTVDFTQVPVEATVASGITFVNTSTSTSRVGTGLPDCGEYDWTWTVDGTPTEYNDKIYTYELEVTPGSVDSQVKLCANWSDGWVSHETCVEKEVVFNTAATVSEQDCFFNLNIVGTSSDGSTTGYSWTIASGISDTGPWTETWATPTGVEQNDKKVCFTSVGWYNITGYVYGTGTTTSDSETLYIDVVCPATTSGIEVISHLWNGTGVLDVGGDWVHTQYGTETAESKHTGTNGLDASGMKKTSKIWFTNPDGAVDANVYDAFVMWINVRSWQAGKDITVELHTLGGNSVYVYLSRYLTEDATGVWQKVSIPLTHFGNTGSFNVDRLRLWPDGNIGLWLDDIYFSIGAMIGVAVCDPDMYGEEFGQYGVTADTLVPSGQSGAGLIPSGKVGAGFVPSGQAAQGFVPSGKPVFPGPSNL